MRSEVLYLKDILEAADAVRRFMEGVSQDAFMESDLVQSAVLQKLSLIGEAAGRLPETFRERHSEIQWADIIGFRNIAVHAYFDVDWSIVWVTANDDVPLLRQMIAQLLEQEFPDEAGA